MQHLLEKLQQIDQHFDSVNQYNYPEEHGFNRIENIRIINTFTNQEWASCLDYIEKRVVESKDPERMKGLRLRLDYLRQMSLNETFFETHQPVIEYTGQFNESSFYRIYFNWRQDRRHEKDEFAKVHLQLE